MYSLYGVVVHSGGMQDGHYTAFTKTRPHLKTPVLQTLASKTEQESARNESPTPTEPSKHSEDTSPPTSVEDREGTSSPCESPPTAAIQELSSSEKAEELVSSPKEFDYSCAAGQWYYASDTHVRTATEAEVMRSQAYLLFYERLPFLL